jgi:hypothetical protein
MLTAAVMDGLALAGFSQLQGRGRPIWKYAVKPGYSDSAEYEI